MSTKPKVTCRRCGTAVWKLFTTTSVTIDTSVYAHETSAYLKREYRCSNCSTKATLEQVAQLESLTQTTVKESPEINQDDSHRDFL